MKNLAKAIIVIFIAFTSYAAIRIDITAPGRKLPIAISDLGGVFGEEVSQIIRDDLEFTGIFHIIDKKAFIEPPDKPFSRANWAMLGVEAALKGDTRLENGVLKVSARLFDISDGSMIFQKEYEAQRELLRPLAHTIAGEIYSRLTGENNVFRSKLSFVVSEKKQKEISISDWDGQRLRRLGITATSIVSPKWSPDGESLIYSALRDSRWGIYIFSLRDGKERLIHSSKGILIAGNFLPDSRGFVFSSPEGIFLYMFNGDIKKITSSRGIDVSATISPDGEKIAFVSDRGGTPQIYIINLSDYNITRMTFEGSYNTSPVWSPSGEIAFVGRYSGKNQIFLINPDGSSPRRLTEQGNNEEPTFSPDGRFIAFSSDRDGERAIYIMRKDGDGQKRISPRGLPSIYPSWSPK